MDPKHCRSFCHMPVHPMLGGAGGNIFKFQVSCLLVELPSQIPSTDFGVIDCTSWSQMSKCSKTSCIFIVWWLCFWVGSILIKHIFILLIWFFAIIFENLLPDCFWAIVAFPPARKWRRKRRRAAVLPSPITAGNKNGRCRCRGKPARGWAKVPRCFWSFEDPNEKVRCYCSGWPGVVFWDEPLWAPSRGEVGPSPCGFDVRNSPPKGVQQARLRGPDSEFRCGYMHPTWRAFTLVLLRLGYSVIVKLANWSLSCKFLSCECRTQPIPTPCSAPKSRASAGEVRWGHQESSRQASGYWALRKGRLDASGFGLEQLDHARLKRVGLTIWSVTISVTILGVSPSQKPISYWNFYGMLTFPLCQIRWIWVQTPNPRTAALLLIPVGRCQ